MGWQLVLRTRAIQRTAILAAILATGCSESKSSTVITPLVPNHSTKSQRPEALSLDEVNLPDDHLVIGVSTGNKERAFLLEALDTQSELPPESEREAGGHVINDVVGETPITVTYCAETKLCRVLTSEGNKPLDVAMKSVSEGGMELVVNGQQYQQSDPNLPLQDYKYELTTWGKWKAEHPQTDVYIGPLDEG